MHNHMLLQETESSMSQSLDLLVLEFAYNKPQEVIQRRSNEKKLVQHLMTDDLCCFSETPETDHEYMGREMQFNYMSVDHLYLQLMKTTF